MQRLTCYNGLLPTSNKLSSFLHLSWGNLVSYIWQATRLHGGFQPREGRASSRGKLSSFLSDHREEEEFVFLSVSLSLTVSACSLGEDLHCPSACYARLSLTVQNKQTGVRGWNTKCPLGAGLVVVLTLSLLPPENHSRHLSMLSESDTETGSWAEVKYTPCVLPEGEMSVYTTGMMPATPPNPLLPDTSLSPTFCSCSFCVQTDLWGGPQNL